MTYIKERVTQIPKIEGLSQESFFSELGLSYSNFKGSQKKSSLSSDAIEKIISLRPNISLEWLILGKGEMYVTKFTEKVKVPFFINEQTINVSESKKKQIFFNINNYFRGATSVFRIEGDSMFPEYKRGSLVVLKSVKKNEVIVYGQDYLIATSNFNIVKRIYKSNENDLIICRSINQIKYNGTKDLVHDDFEIPNKDIFSLHRVIGCITNNESDSVVSSF